MKMIFAAALLGMATISSPVLATDIPGITNTGQSASGGQDNHWKLGSTNAYVGTGINGAWQPDNSTSSWLTPTADGNASLDPTTNGSYTYSISFDLSGFNPATAVLGGIFAVDNQVSSILLNGNLVTFSGPNACCSFGTGGSFLANSGFQAGLNTLSFVTTNLAQQTGNPTGLRVEFNENSVTAVPEPLSWVLMILGFGLIGAFTRRSSAGDLAFA